MLRAESEIMDIHALQQIVHQTRDARRKQTIPKFAPADRDQLIHKYHPDYRASAYRPIRFGPNANDKTVVELAALLEGDSSIAENVDLTPHYTTDVLVIGGGGAGCAAALHAHGAGAKVILATKLRLGDSNSVMAQGDANFRCSGRFPGHSFLGHAQGRPHAERP